MMTSSTGRSLAPFATSSEACLRTTWKIDKDVLTNQADDVHALKHFSEHNLKIMSPREEGWMNV